MLSKGLTNGRVGSTPMMFSAIFISKHVIPKSGEGFDNVGLFQNSIRAAAPANGRARSDPFEVLASAALCSSVCFPSGSAASCLPTVNSNREAQTCGPPGRRPRAEPKLCLA